MSVAFNEPLDSTVLDIEDKTRGNIFTWRGQFSPQLIESLLNAYCPKGVQVFDPFGGSGTVLYECAVLGKEAHVTELNPAAWILSRTYEQANLPISERKAAFSTVRDFLSDKFPQEILTGGETPLSLDRLTLAVQEFDEKDRKEVEQQIFAATIVLLDIYAKPATPGRIDQVLYALSKKALALPEVELPVKAHLADARKTPFENDTFGFVVSSPPYINVFNYHQNYRASTELLGWDLLKVARSEIGSNRANRGNRFLTVVQYCFDMGDVLEELHRVCRGDANVILVVGRESAVLGIPWKNSAIVQSLAEESGYFKCGLIQERKFRNKFGVTIYEDLLHLTPGENAFGGIRKSAEAVARRIFRKAIQVADKKAAPLLEEAADKIPSLDGTPVFAVNE